MPDGSRFEIRRAATRAEDDAEMEMSLPPGVAGPPLHQHARMRETYVVIEGVLDVTRGSELRRLGVGEQIVVEASTPHTFRNAGIATVRFRVVHTPALRFEAYMRELGELARRGVLRDEPLHVIPMSIVWNRYDDCFEASAWGMRILMHVLGWVGRWHPRFRHV